MEWWARAITFDGRFAAGAQETELLTELYFSLSRSGQSRFSRATAFHTGYAGRDKHLRPHLLFFHT
jgi:hypothetical protein